MNFLTRFIIVIVWMMGISASSLAVTKKCAKNEKTILRYTIQTPQNTHQTTTSASDKSAAICSGSISFYCVPSEENAIFQFYRNTIIYPGFITLITLSGFKNIPYSPPPATFEYIEQTPSVIQKISYEEATLCVVQNTYEHNFPVCWCRSFV